MKQHTHNNYFIYYFFNNIYNNVMNSKDNYYDNILFEVFCYGD